MPLAGGRCDKVCRWGEEGFFPTGAAYGGMMKPTQVTELLQTIRTTFVSFFSILMFVALGVGIFLGIAWSGMALRNAAESAFEQGAFHHFQIQYPYGLAQSDIDEISKVEGVIDVEPAFQVVRTLESGGENYVIRIQTLGERIDVPLVREGALPAAADEIAIKQSSAAALGVHVGDTITLAAAPEGSGLSSIIEGAQSFLVCETFTVTALVESPDYIARSGSTMGMSVVNPGVPDALAWVPAAAFDDSAYLGGYTLTNVRCAGLEGADTFSSRYREASAPIEAALAECGKPLASSRFALIQALVEEALGRVGIDDELARRVEEARPGLLLKLRAHVDELREYDWIVLPRTYNGGVMEATVFSNVATSLSFSMAALFVIVGLLVSYSAVGRIVHERVVQIGTKKALGLRDGEITTSFLAYAGAAVVLGAAVGAAVGVGAVEGIINAVLGSRFVLGAYPPAFDLAMLLAVAVAELALVVGASWLACRSVLRLHAVELLKGPKPPEGKTRFFEKWPAWEKLPLYTQTIVSNCLNDKRRVLGTIVGVAGCTALIVTAITLNDDVLASYDRQYQDVYGFDAIASVDEVDIATRAAQAAEAQAAEAHKEGASRGGSDSSPGASNSASAITAEKARLTEAALDDLQAVLQAKGAACAKVLRERYALTQPDGGRAAATVIVPADERSFSAVYHVKPTSGGTYALGDDGAWVSQAYASHLGAKVGDEIRLDVGDGVLHSVPISGFYEFYLPHNEVVMSWGLYEKTFGEPALANSLLVGSGAAGIADLRAACAGVRGFGSLANDKAAQQGNFNSFASVSRTVVLVYLALAVLMAVVVLLNLNVMFISEKKRELIVLMINGFSTREAKRYIYQDTIVLTVLGIAAGVVLGCAMGVVTVAAIEPVTAVFVKDIAWRAVGAGVAGSAVLACAMSAIALRRISSFELTDINRA